jgi:CheY-like chemotaxis protein
MDALVALIGLAPFRCRVCRERFYRIWQPFENDTEPPSGPVLVMPFSLLLNDPISDSSDAFEVQPMEPQRPMPQLMEAPSPAKKVRFVRPRSVLILEGDLSIRKLLRRLLDRRGYFTCEVADPKDLESELRERRVDLLIVDAPLLGADGAATAFALAQNHPDLKILAFLPEPENRGEPSARCLTLSKPFSLDSFIQSVDRLLAAPE